MSDQNVKMKTSTIAPVPEHKESPVDSFQKNGPKQPKFSAGNSNYNSANPMTTGWKGLSNTSPKMALPFGMEEDSIIESIAPMAADLSSEITGQNLNHYSTSFRPRTGFDFYRLQFETPDLTKQFDLKATVPPIPSFSKIYGQIKDIDYIKRFYVNRMGMLNDLIKNTENELKANVDPSVLNARSEFLTFLKRRKNFVEKQLIAVSDKEKSEIS